MAARRIGVRGDLAIAALWGASSGTVHFLATAAELVAARHARLQMFVQAANESAVEGLRQQMSDSLGETTHQAAIIPIATDHPEAVFSALITTSADLLTIDAGNPRCSAPGPSGVASLDSTARC